MAPIRDTETARMHDKSIELLLQGLNILIVDGNHYMRRLTRSMLTVSYTHLDVYKRQGV